MKIDQLDPEFEKNDHWLLQYEKDVTSQNGEDGIIEKIFSIVPVAQEPWCVEFGAADGLWLSNVWNLIVHKGWSSVLIEGSKKEFEKLVQNYSKYKKVVCLNEFVAFEGKQSLDAILSRTAIPENFELLIIDIDGNDYHIAESLKRYKPKVMVVEFNPSIPADIEFIQAKDFKVWQGSSFLAIVKLAKSKGYELVASTACNAFFVKEEYFKYFKIKNNDAAHIFPDKKFQTRIFQLYDGTFVMTGYDRMIWHRIPINSERLQMFPKFLRKYPATMSPFWAEIIYRPGKFFSRKGQKVSEGITRGLRFTGPLYGLLRSGYRFFKSKFNSKN